MFSTADPVVAAQFRNYFGFVGINLFVKTTTLISTVLSKRMRLFQIYINYINLVQNYFTEIFTD